ncbi:hypothetical protein N9Y42_07015 [Mariniblastus sp.]|nr:hypothetical protein [Mariniblastus sp.]
MNTSSLDDRQPIFVRALPVAENSQEKELAAASRICAVLATGLIVYRIVFYSQWLDGFKANQFIMIAVTLILSVVCYLLLSRLLKFALQQMQDYIAPKKLIQANTVRSWLLSKRIIQRQFDSHVQSFSATAVKCMNADEDGLDLYFKSGEQDRLDKDGFSSPEDFADAQELLLEAMVLDSSVQQPPETIPDEVVVSGGYTKEEAIALHQYTPHASPFLSRYAQVQIVLVILMFGTLLAMHYFSEEGISAKTFVTVSFVYFATLWPGHLTGWQLRTAAMRHTRRWSFSASGFNCCTFYENSYCMVSRSWDQLEKFEQNEVGLFLFFADPYFITLIPAWLVTPELLAKLKAHTESSTQKQTA